MKRLARRVGRGHFAGWAISTSALCLLLTAWAPIVRPAAALTGSELDRPGISTAPGVPVPLPGHPGNVFLERDDISIPVPEEARLVSTPWRLSDGRQVLRTGILHAGAADAGAVLNLGPLSIGWYRLDFGSTNASNQPWTSLAVLGRMRTPPPAGSPIAVDSAAAWFARENADLQQQLASLAALAGVGWVRDRLRWGDIQPQPGDLAAPPTTYDTSADAHREAGLAVLQVFHDTPPWARNGGSSGGQFAPDLRRVFELGRRLAKRFKGRVAAWEPWNEANVAAFGAHTVDQMCSWQKAAWLGFKSGDPDVLVGWNATAAVPTIAHTEGVLANETWPYFDTYNIHTYDWPHGYADLWKPVREAAAGRPIWITEADRGTPHIKNAPWYDQDPRLERLKAEWMAQSYSSSLFSGAQRHFHFILGNYQEPNGVQFGLLRLDLTPRPAYVALAAVGRSLARAKILGRWQPGQDVQVYAFRAKPEERDVLVIWAEKEVDWNGRGITTADWKLPSHLTPTGIVDYLGRSRGTVFPTPLTSAPTFVFIPLGQAASLPLDPPPALATRRTGKASPIVMQSLVPNSAVRKVEDVPWSAGYVYHTTPGQSLEFKLQLYNFATNAAQGRLLVAQLPTNWELELATASFQLPPMGRAEVAGNLKIPSNTWTRDGSVIVRAECGAHGQSVIACRVVVDE